MLPFAENASPPGLLIGHLRLEDMPLYLGSYCGVAVVVAVGEGVAVDKLVACTAGNAAPEAA